MSADSQTEPTSVLLTRAVAAHRAGDLAAAERTYRQVLTTAPDNFDALHLLGVIAIQRHDYAAAVQMLDRAAAANPDVATLFHNRGHALLALERFGEAAASFERAVTLDPHNVNARVNHGNALRALGRYEEALASYDGALAHAHDHAEAHRRRADVLILLNRIEAGIAAYDRAIALAPGDADAHAGRGAALDAARRFDEALASYDTAVTLKPDFAAAHHHRGDVLLRLKRYPEALASYDRAVALAPHTDLLEGVRLHVKMHLCDWRDFDADCARLRAAVADGRIAAHPFALIAIPSTPALQRRCAETYLASNHPPAATPSWRGRGDHARLRLAYLSADFHAHATATLAAGLFEQHDRARFETYAVSFGPDDGSDMRGRLIRAFDHFIDVRNEDDAAVAARLRALEIDIAVDLKGFTQGARTGILAQRVAPVQVSYLGYPGTMGAPYVDAIIADRVVIPAGQRAHFSEQVIELPDSYQINDATRAIADTPMSRADAGLPSRGLVFCCFNDTYKITPDVFDIWMRLLRDVDGSVLWLLAGNIYAPDNLRREATARGVAPQRLVFAPRLPSDEHLARQRLADLFLDTHPCNAHTTASDALWAGLPLVTCAGETFAARVAASLLHAVGLPELVTQSLADYEALALKLARDAALLASIRDKLAHNRRTAPLFDTRRTTRNLEAAYSQMWEAWRRE
jgi:predicted O-linked N-acetylglucosamine transferase (SPINDLY family)